MTTEQNTPTAPEKPSREHTRRTWKQRLVWPGMVFGLISISVTLMSITLFLAIRDSSFGVEEDYYAKAVAWDETAESREASKKLGWQMTVTLADTVDFKGERGVRVELVDSDSVPVDASAGEVFAFHHARRKETVVFRLAKLGPGRFAAGARLDRDGMWQLRLRFDRGEDAYSGSLDVLTGETTSR